MDSALRERRGGALPFSMDSGVRDLYYILNFSPTSARAKSDFEDRFADPASLGMQEGRAIR
jgi:hypothetical protein